MNVVKRNNELGKIVTSLRCVSLVCAVLMSIGALATSMPAATDSVTITSHPQYPYVVYVDNAYIPTLDNEQFQNVAATVIFPVNQTRLPKNAPLLVELRDEVLPLLNSDSIEALEIDLRGAASPEGTLKHNTWLGENRMKALLNYIQDGLEVPVESSKMRMLSEAEDYLTLTLLMRKAGDADYSRVKRLCDIYLPAGDYVNLKRELRLMDGGALWQRMLREYYPRLRTAQLVIFCKRKTQQPEQNLHPTLWPWRVGQTAEFRLDTLRFELPQHKIARRELLSLKTNALLYGVYMPGGYNKWCPIPNFTIEYYPWHGHFTYAFTFDCPWWQDYWGHKYFQIRNYQLEARYYFRSGDIKHNPPGQGQAFRGLYVQGYANLALYGLCFDADRGWVGEGIGAGVGVGYVMPLGGKTSRWKLEFSAQLGFFSSKYDPYQFENLVNPNYRDHLYYYRWTQHPDLFKKRLYRNTWFGPTRVGITISYDLLFRRTAKKGASFRRWE